jgi:hypothetical protein
MRRFKEMYTATFSSPCVADEAVSQSPLPPSFALRATDGPPSPLARGGSKEALG